MSLSEQSNTLADDQLDGLACVRCGAQGGPMVPAGVGPRGQLFEHADTVACADALIAYYAQESRS